MDQDRLAAKSARTINIFHNPWTAWIILFISLCLTGSAYFVSKATIMQRQTDRFYYRAEKIASDIKDRMQVYEQVLWGVVGFFNASNHVDRDEFKRYVDALGIQDHWPGIQGIGYIVPLLPDEVSKHERAVMESGLKDYIVHPRGARDFYTAVVYLEPYDWRNRRAFGFDMWSDVTRRKAMQQALEENVAVTTAITKLVQETEKNIQKGFLTYLPVYKKDMPIRDKYERRDALQGWVYAPFRTGDLMRGILGERESDIQFEIYDSKEADEANLLYSSFPDKGRIFKSEKDSQFTKLIVQTQERIWTVQLYAPKDYGAHAGEAKQPVMVAMGGCIVDILLFYVIWSIYFLQKKAAALAKKMTEERERALEKLEHANNAKSQFLANMSHEIRTPMNGILGSSEILLASGLKGGQRKYADIINHSTKSLLTVINDILDYSKLESGKMQIDPVPTLLSEVLINVRDLFVKTAEDKSLDFKVLLPEDDRLFLADPVRIRQILINLVGNAIKFTSEGEVELSVKIKPWHDNYKITFLVKDTGRGMDAKELDKIFEQFSQGDSSITREYGGTGLGLSISKQLALLMGGDIEVASVPGKGSTFALRLTLSEVDEKTIYKDMSASGEDKVYNKKKILLVEDNFVNQEVAKNMLESMGIDVDVAENGQVCLDKLAGERYDLVLMDMQMPVMDGLTATKEIRKSPQKFKSIPIVAMTANAGEAYARQCREAGMNGYLAKPVQTSDLITELDKWLK